MGEATGRRGWGAVGALAVAAVCLTCPADAQTGSSYTATADSRLVAIDVLASPTILFDPLFDGGESVAQAQIDSLGGTTAFASNVYPGATVLGLPGLLAGYGFPSESVPTYPLVARSDQVTPADHKEAGTVVLDAQSQPGSSSGQVTDGGASAAARTVAEPDGGAVTASAEAMVPSLQLGEALQLNGLRSSAEVRRTASGDIERSSTFEVSSLTVLGRRVAVTPSGLSILGMELPLGLDPDVLLADLLGSLSDQGTTIDVLPAVETEDGITSAGLRITTVIVPPPEVASGLESITTAVTFGRVSATVANSAFGLGGGRVAPPASVPVSNAPVGASPAGSIGNSTVASAPRATSPAASPAAAAASAATSVIEGTSIALDIELARFYPVLVLAAVVGVAIVSLIRQLGVRQP